MICPICKTITYSLRETFICLFLCGLNRAFPYKIYNSFSIPLIMGFHWRKRWWDIISIRYIDDAHLNALNELTRVIDNMTNDQFKEFRVILRGEDLNG